MECSIIVISLINVIMRGVTPAAGVVNYERACIVHYVWYQLVSIQIQVYGKNMSERAPNMVLPVTLKTGMIHSASRNGGASARLYMSSAHQLI